MFQVKSLSLTRSVSISCFRQKDDFQDLIHPEGREPNIPHYVEREGENADLKRARYRAIFIRVNKLISLTEMNKFLLSLYVLCYISYLL